MDQRLYIGIGFCTYLVSVVAHSIASSSKISSGFIRIMGSFMNGGSSQKRYGHMYSLPAGGIPDSQ
jgi:hypothetical protein